MKLLFKFDDSSFYKSTCVFLMMKITPGEMNMYVYI